MNPKIFTVSIVIVTAALVIFLSSLAIVSKDGLAIVSSRDGQRNKASTSHEAAALIASNLVPYQSQIFESGFLAGYICKSLGGDANDLHNLRIAIRSNRFDVVHGWMLYKSNKLASAQQ